jgi:hypothetical protein
MAENKTARTSADGPEYERGFVDGMQRQMQLHVNRVIREEPTGWVKVYETIPPKREWVGLTEEEINNSYLFWVVDQQDVLGFGKSLETKLKRKNT